MNHLKVLIESNQKNTNAMEFRWMYGLGLTWYGK